MIKQILTFLSMHGQRFILIIQKPNSNEWEHYNNAPKTSIGQEDVGKILKWQSERINSSKITTSGDTMYLFSSSCPISHEDWPRKEEGNS